MTHSFRHVS
ncbi:MAG: hypothetical protein GY803_06285 [Chloroflexi bacterium]|nr:hypothetical protein [Chloroflexota bacterium]